MGDGDLGRLVVKIAADADELAKGVAQAKNVLQGFSKSAGTILGAIGFATIATGFAKITASAISYGEELNKVSQATGMAASEVAKLKFVAEQSDTSIGALQASMSVLTRQMLAASNGSQDARLLFERFHVSFQNADGTLRNYRDVMLDVSDRIKNTSDKSLALASAQELLGRNARETFQFFNQGADSIRKLENEFSKLGVSDRRLDAFAKAADDVSDKWQKLKLAFQLVAVQIAEHLMPHIDAFIERMVSADWAGIAQNISLVAEAFRATAEWVEKAVGWMQQYSPLAAAARFAGTLAGGGSLGDANAAMFNTGMVGQGQAERLGSEQNPVNLGAVSTGGAGGPGISGMQGDMFGGIQKSMDELKAKWGDINKSIGEVWASTMEQIASGFGTGVADMIVEGKNFGDSMKQLWKDIAKSVIAEIVAIIAQQMILFAWQVVTGTVGSGNLGGIGGGKKKFFGLFREGGAFTSGSSAMAWQGARQAREGIMSTGPMGEGGIPVIAHPNEIISPIDKFFDMIRGAGGVHVTVMGDVKDPRDFSEMLALEIERHRRNP